jgi:hypothetical protein
MLACCDRHLRRSNAASRIANKIVGSGITTVRFGQSIAMNDSAASCPICGEAAEVVQVSIEDGWSEAATHLVTIRACTNRYCEGHHPAVRPKVRAPTAD